MHALINKALQSYVSACHGQQAWKQVAVCAGVPSDPLDIMLQHPADQTDVILRAMENVLNRDRVALLEDLGTFLASNPICENLRRLLRFGGQNFMEFSLSLPDMPARVRLAVPDMPMPRLRIERVANPVDVQAHLRLICYAADPSWGHVLLGLIRAMADDYGALALFKHTTKDAQCSLIDIEIVESGFATPRQFNLRKPLFTSQAAQ